MKSTTDGKRSPDLEPLIRTLRIHIASGGEPLRDCFRDMDLALHGGSRKKVNYLPLIANATRAALEHPRATAVLLSAVENMPFRPTPETVLRGAIQVERSPDRDELLYELAGCLEAPLSPKLAEELEKNLGKDFLWFAVLVWDRNGLRHSDPSWCRVWGSLCQEIARSLTVEQEKAAREVLEKIIARIETLQGQPAEAFGPLVLFLFSREIPGLAKDLLDRLARTAAAHQARQLISGNRGEPELPPPVSSSTVSIKPLPVNSGASFSLEGVSPQAIHALSVLCEELHSSGRGTRGITQRLEQIERECNRLRAEKEEMRAREKDFQDEISRREKSLREITGALKREQETVTEVKTQTDVLNRRLDEVRTELDLRSRELREAQDAYHRLDGQSSQEKADLHSQIMTSIQMDLQEPWKLMSLMLNMVIRGEREARHLLSMWNRLDDTLAQLVGREMGHPIQIPPGET